MEERIIEKAAANLADPNLCKTDNWIEGAKWMQERMYSEEDLKEAFKQVRYCKIFEDTQFEDWLEQFKKK